MTYDQFWNDDPMLCKYYRQAYEIKRETENEKLWLQGMYVYEAIADLTPILHAFAAKGSKPNPYPSKPFPITRKSMKKDKSDRAKKDYERKKRYMETMMAEINKRFTADKTEVVTQNG